jgi:hypothetical protein
MAPSSTDASAVLGPALRKHGTRLSYLLTTTGIGLFFTLAGAVAVVQFVRRALEDPSGETLAVGLLTSVPFLLAGGLTLWWASRRFGKVVTVHQGGFHYRDRKGEWVVPWHAVDGVYQKIVRVLRAGVEVDVRDEYTIALFDGRTLEIDYHFEDVDAFGYALTTALTGQRLAGARQAFAAGQALDFGAVLLDRSGIAADGKTLPWHEVESVSWKAGILSSDRAFVQIKRVGGLLAWAKVPVERVKNYHVFVSIVADLGKSG